MKKQYGTCQQMALEIRCSMRKTNHIAKMTKMDLIIFSRQTYLDINYDDNKISANPMNCHTQERKELRACLTCDLRHSN